jgi:exodeoxyribonuclease V alpha subunit
VFNGDVGIVHKIDESLGTLSVLYDDNKYVVYDSKELDEIVLAYCITVHKSQGSEFPVVVIPLYDVPYMLLNRNLFYTGITRARDLVVLVGREDIMRKMVDNNRENKRYSGLGEKLKNEKGIELF